MQPQPPIPPELPKSKGSILTGVTIGFGITLLVGMFVGVSPMPEILIGLGLLQYVWVVPICLWLRKAGETQTANGLWIMSGIIVLLNAACAGLIWGMSGLDFK